MAHNKRRRIPCPDLPGPAYHIQSPETRVGHMAIFSQNHKLGHFQVSCNCALQCPGPIVQIFKEAQTCAAGDILCIEVYLKI